jgi:hypothetical protein
VAAGAALFLAVRFTTAQSPGQDASASKPSLDYAFFKTRVEPILVKKRAGHARCVLCHGRGLGAPQYLVKMAPGSTSWTEEESQRNFQNISKLVVPGNPMTSLFAIHPLAPEAGGDSVHWHGGGRQFKSQDDPDWKTIAEWIRGKKADDASMR